MASGLASFLGRRNVVAPAITVSTIQGSSIATTSITTGALSLSTLTGSTINASSITFSSLTGSTITTSTITSNMLTLSTLTVSSINSGPPGVAAYSTFNASSINTSSITASSITTASGYNSNIGNVLYTSLADSGQTAANLITTGMPGTAPTGSVISGSYRLTAGASSGAAVMRLAYTFVVGTTYNFTFTGMQGSQALALYVYQYNSAGTASIQISASVYSITTSAATVSGSFTPNASGTYTGTIIFYFQAAAVNQYVNFTAFSMNTGAMNVGIGTTNPIAKMQVYQDGNSVLNEVGSHSMGILSNQGTSGTNLMYMMLDADYTNQCCSIQSIIYGLKVWNLILNPRGGNVGIGTTNPGAILHVYDSLTSASSVPLMLFSPNLSTGGSQYLYFGTANSTNNSAQIGWANVGAGSASNYAFLQIYGKANIMTWQASTGNVGIGITNPGAILQVYNGAASYTIPTVSISDGAADNGGAYGMVNLTRPLAPGDYKAHIAMICSGNRVGLLGYLNNTTTMGWVSANSMNSSNGLFLNSSGQVGIGSSSPVYKLDVNGIIRTQSTIVVGTQNSQGWLNLVPVSDSSHTGYIEFNYATTRVGYIGYAVGSTSFDLYAENSSQLQIGAYGTFKQLYGSTSTTFQNMDHIYFNSSNPNGECTIKITNTSTGSAAYTGFQSYQGSTYTTWFVNSSSRSSDGGYNCFTLRNDSGDCRFMGQQGGFSSYGSQGWNPGGATYTNTVCNYTNATTANIGSWSGYGFTLFCNTSTPAGNQAALGLGSNNYNANFITSLSPGVRWMDLYLSAATIAFYMNGSPVGYTVASGGANVSDEREKLDINDLSTATSLKRVMRCRPKYYKRKHYDCDKDGNPLTPAPQSQIDQIHIGLLAQDMFDINPYCLSTWQNKCIPETDEDDGTRYGICYNDWIVHLIGSVQQQQCAIETANNQIATLQAANTTLNGTCATLESKVATLETQVTSLSASYASLSASMAGLLARLEALEAR